MMEFVKNGEFWQFIQWDRGDSLSILPKQNKGKAARL